MTKYIVFEGGEGTYKTTTAKMVVQRLQNAGFNVLHTKEPGTSHLPLTMKLREIMLSNEYDTQLSPYAREFISQAIRQIHLEKLIRPAYASDEYDFIIQDRGILSGLIYAEACGIKNSKQLTPFALGQSGIVDSYHLYDTTIIFTRNEHSLDVALNAKSEFEGGDAMESRGDAFHSLVNEKFKTPINTFSKNVYSINVDSYANMSSELSDIVLELISKDYNE